MDIVTDVFVGNRSIVLDYLSILNVHLELVTSKGVKGLGYSDFEYPNI